MFENIISYAYDFNIIVNGALVRELEGTACAFRCCGRCTTFCITLLSENPSTKRLVGILVPGGRGNTFIPMSCPPHSVYPPKRSRSTTSPNSVAIFALQHPLLPPPWAVPAGDSSFCRQIEHPMSCRIEHPSGFQERLAARDGAVRGPR